MNNPFLALPYVPALESLGAEYYDEVTAAQFPQQILRFRNDDLLPRLGLDPAQVTDENFIQAFGQFAGRMPLLALRYHGYQFGEYNPRLGDGRGFLYGQVQGTDGELYDLGTKGSGTTPYSRSADGRLTLKGGIREVLAAEALQAQGVYTSRCLSLIETGEQLWRGDEPSPTRASVMVRFSRSHIRFGTFERFLYLERPDLTQKLLDHVIEQYYPHLQRESDRYALFYAELVQRVARLCAQWMAVGFCHGVLNTDNMSVTGESFDYGPYAFITHYDPTFTAAYFDHYRRYCFGNQPGICHLNLELLQRPLALVIPQAEMESGLADFAETYTRAYQARMLEKMGLPPEPSPQAEELCMSLLRWLEESKQDYHEFFVDLSENFSPAWFTDIDRIPDPTQPGPFLTLFMNWKTRYHQQLMKLSIPDRHLVPHRLKQNPTTVLVRPQIEAIWEAISQQDDWEPFYDLLNRLRAIVYAPLKL
ncbi:YdiU family protein [Candidatus Cyanaurora vandensis]|uniref:protein adenylyltransferase SelO n=1 Tax=Candidatus Cyanaurora vandensis TaxID=2714958 RepID=UPI00257E6A2A|nr:YdiU family protein [Candidatus Cyanaurora vandensis]